MRTENFVIHPREGLRIISYSEALNEAKRQKAENALTFRYNFGRGEYSKPGYLIYSTYADGAGVFILSEDESGGYMLKGWQGDFITDYPIAKAATT